MWKGGGGVGVEEPDGLDASSEERRLATRRALFSVLVVVLAGVSLWFVVITLKTGRIEDPVWLSADARYTVKVGEVPSTRRDLAQKMLQHPVLVSLVEGRRLFLHDIPGDKIALCAGSFRSGDSREAQDLLERLRSYTRDGHRAFGSATIWRCAPANAQ